MIDFKDLDNALNEYQKESIRSAILTGMVEKALVNIVINSGVTLEERKGTLIDRVVAPYNMKRMNAELKETIDKGEWIVMGVFGNEEESPFAYSIGASTPTKSFEVMCSGIANKTAHRVVNAAVTHLRRDTADDLELPFAIADEPMRFKVVKKPLEEVVKKYAFGVKQHVDTNIVQEGVMYIIILGDKNNRLPGEDGYDETFKQFYATAE